jgi:hypothetical protein
VTFAVESLLGWGERLVGLERERTERAVRELAGWRLPHLTEEFLDRADLDALVGGVLLVESVESLCEHGIPRNKLMKKLRDARDPWPVWAEIRSAAILVGYPGWDIQLEMEALRSRGKHADFRVTWDDGSQTSIEFKAVGLSEAELSFHQRAADQFEALLPPIGLSNAHGYLDQPLRVSQAKRDRAWRRSKKLDRTLRRQPLTAGWAGLRGIAVVGHYTEGSYLARVRSRIQRALDQLPEGEDSWIAFWWGNGAPMEGVQQLLDSLKAPPHIAGLMFIGQAVAVPWADISCFILGAPRGAVPGQREVHSAVDDALAERVLERFDSSSGVRPTLLRSAGADAPQLMRRDGSRRLTPFNLLFDSDPRILSPPVRPPSPVQDTKIIR